MEWQDHYRVLGINRNATSDEIMVARNSKAKCYHPDKHGSVDMMKEVNLAYEDLSDSKRKTTYDLEWDRRNPGWARKTGFVGRVWMWGETRHQTSGNFSGEAEFEPLFKGEVKEEFRPWSHTARQSDGTAGQEKASEWTPYECRQVETDSMGRIKYPENSQFGAGKVFNNIAFGANCKFGPRCAFNNCTFGQRSVFEPGSSFKRCTIFEECEIGHNCSFVNVKFGSSCQFKTGCSFDDFSRRSAAGDPGGIRVVSSRPGPVGSHSR